MDNVLLKCNFCSQGGYDAGVLIIPTALKVLQSIMKCLSWEPTYQLGRLAINTNTEGEEFPHFWYIYFQHCRHYWCASIMLTAPLKVQWRNNKRHNYKRQSSDAASLIFAGPRFSLLQLKVMTLSPLISKSTSVWFPSCQTLSQLFFLFIPLCRNSLVHVASAHETYMGFTWQAEVFELCIAL